MQNTQMIKKEDKYVFFDMVEIIPGTGNAMIFVDYNIYMRFLENGEQIGVQQIGPEEDPKNPGYCMVYPEIIQTVKMHHDYSSQELQEIAEIGRRIGLEQAELDSVMNQGVKVDKEVSL